MKRYELATNGTQKSFYGKAVVEIDNAGNETGRYTAFYIPVVTVDRFTGETPTAYTLGTVKQYDYSVMEG